MDNRRGDCQGRGLLELGEAHWKIIDFCRQERRIHWQRPHPARHHQRHRIPTKELFTLYPKGPAKKVARIAVWQTQGCV